MSTIQIGDIVTSKEEFTNEFRPLNSKGVIVRQCASSANLLTVVWNKDIQATTSASVSVGNSRSANLQAKTFDLVCHKSKIRKGDKVIILCPRLMGISQIYANETYDVYDIESNGNIVLKIDDKYYYVKDDYLIKYSDFYSETNSFSRDNDQDNLLDRIYDILGD